MALLGIRAGEWYKLLFAVIVRIVYLGIFLLLASSFGHPLS